MDLVERMNATLEDISFDEDELTVTQLGSRCPSCLTYYLGCQRTPAS
jgi:hypothetical protein